MHFDIIESWIIANYIFEALTYRVFLFLVIALIFIMCFGYIGRVAHCKQSFKDFNYDLDKTSNFLQQHYNSWIFIG